MRIAAFIFLLCTIGFAQTAVDGKPAASSAESSPIPAEVVEIVKKQFGPDFEIATKKSAGNGFKYLNAPNENWTPFLTADLDGDGVEDAVIVARSRQPLAGEAVYHYKVIDPYFTAYGYGDPRITSTMASEDPDNRNLVLVIHGSGKEAWRAATPKAKFVIINLPIKNIALRQTMMKKHVVAAIDPQSEESNGAMVIWDGKKYKWMEANGK